MAWAAEPVLDALAISDTSSEVTSVASMLIIMAAGEVKPAKSSPNRGFITLRKKSWPAQGTGAIS